MKNYLCLSVFFLLSFCGKDKTTTGTSKSKWITEAFASIASNQYPKLKAIAWWHENFDKSLLRIDSSPKSLAAYKAAVSSSTFISTANFNSKKLIEPGTGIYHSAFPDFGGTEDEVSTQRINEFETLAAKDIVWAYFSNNWYTNIEFPITAVNTIQEAGKIPFIRMMPRSNFEEGGPDPVYTMQKIIDGEFDPQLKQWAIDAASFGRTLLVEFGTEVNGNWFPWNGQYNGADTREYGNPNLADGPERFRDAYQHIIDICRNNNATNITWFFHVDAYSQPDVAWNDFKNYYPGDDYIDWLGVSIYGPQEKGADYQSFSEIMNDIYPSLISLSNNPIAVLEFAITELD